MLVRWRPQIFVSSSIAGMETVRLHIKNAIEALEFAESWIFEYSATTAGTKPADQYLQSARDSDVFVIVIGDEVREGTAEEYEEAVRDSATKVLPFFVGEGTAETAAFRARLRERHTCMPVKSLDDLPAAIARAVQRFVESGDIVRDALVGQVAAIQAERRSSLGVPEGFEFHRRLVDAHAGNPDPAVLLEDVGHSVLIGEAGSGKSDAALGALLHAAGNDHPRLALLLRARPEVTGVEQLADEAFGRVRFTAGEAAIRQYLADGRVALVVDGIDELPAVGIGDLFASLIEAAERYPRTPILVLTRNRDSGLPGSWSRVELEPIASADLDALFSAFGYSETHITWSLPSDLDDLVRLPFWAILLAQFGRDAKSGMSLLERLIESRIQVGLRVDHLRRESLLEAICWLALTVQPAAEMRTDRTLDIVGAWLVRADVARRFEDRTAQSIVEDACRAGLITIEQETTRFVHPLVATYLAARGASRQSLPADLVPTGDLAAMISVLLPADRESESVALLRDGGIFAVSKALRLSGQSEREPEPDDIVRFDSAYRILSAAALKERTDGTWHRLVTLGYHCLRQGAGSEPTESLDVPLSIWGSVGGPTEYFCWATDPFAQLSPLLLAARLVLDAFKRRLLDIRPNAEPFVLDAKASDLLPLTDKTRRIILDHVVAQRAARESFLAAMGLRGSILDTNTGMPVITVHSEPRGDWYSTQWGADAASVVVTETEPDRGTSITELLANPEAVAYRHLLGEIEDQIGSSATTQAVRHPSSFDWAL